MNIMLTKKMSSLVLGHQAYDDRNYDTVYFNEELAHDFVRMGIGGFHGTRNTIMKSVALIRERDRLLIMTEQSML